MRKAQDYVRADMWFNLAASAGYSDASKSIKIVETEIKPEQIAEAQRMARECQGRNFKDCD
jgi:hypothetical protein